MKKGPCARSANKRHQHQRLNATTSCCPSSNHRVRTKYSSPPPRYGRAFGNYDATAPALTLSFPAESVPTTSGRIVNQIEYIAGRKTKVRIVPAKVPPISV